MSRSNLDLVVAALVIIGAYVAIAGVGDSLTLTYVAGFVAMMFGAILIFIFSLAIGVTAER
jgi:hypothetical protein